MFDLTSEQSSQLQGLVDRLSPGQQLGLNPREEGDRDLIELFLDLSNKRSDRYPALHAALANGDPPPADYETDLRLVDLGATSEGQATARAWHASQGNSVLAGAASLVLDSDSGEPLAFGASTRVGESLTPAATDHETAKPAGEGVVGLGFFHSQRTPEEQPSFGVAMTRREQLDLGLVAINVVDPRIKVAGHTSIKIAIGRERGKSNTDVDYVYYEPQNIINNPNLIVPFTGKAVLPAQIEIEPGTPSRIKGLQITTQLYAQSTYLPCIKPTQLALSVWVPNPTAHPGELAWEFKYDSEPQAKTLSLQYQETGLPSDLPAYFFFQFSVPVVGSGLPVIFSICSKDYPKQPSTNCKVIEDLWFCWHCLAEGTEVTLADGIRLPIESVDNSMRVRTGRDGGTLGVEATTRGLHLDGVGPGAGTLELTTEGGRKLVLTPNHPVATPDGLVLASDLAAGATVLTEAGPEQVDAVARVESKGVFCNLKLVDEDDRARGLGQGAATFLANGVVVGDSIALLSQYQESRLDPDYMLPRLPEGFHRDYESAIEDTLASR
jgi:hypothetical protein